MTFDVVIGNPPYQNTDGKSSIYPAFVELGLALSKTTCMITRDNWLNGKAFNKLRLLMNNRGSLTKIVHYPVVGEVFKEMKVSVAYFVWESNKQADADYTRIKDGCIEYKSKLAKNKDGFVFYKSLLAKDILKKVSGSDCWLELYNTRSYPFMDKRKRLGLESTPVKDNDHEVAVISASDPIVYTSISNFRNQEDVTSYNVVCGVVINEASNTQCGNAITNIRLIEPMQVSSETWSLIATFRTCEEAQNCKKYIMTKFVRYIANQSVNNRSNVTNNTFRYVPIQDFSNASDIDWSTDINAIDKQLYSKYGLSKEEIADIESTIKVYSDSKQESIGIPATELVANYINTQVQSHGIQ